MGLTQLCCADAIEPTIDFKYPKEKSKALTDTKDTYLGKYVAPLVAERPSDQSGFRFMVDGTDALAARLVMARKAEKSIDAQYYLLKMDTVGRTFCHTLLQAADRGVRVRLLLDDMFTKGYDSGMAALCSHPNFEVRVYNPFQRNDLTERSLSSNLADFNRVNRRMHNKTFTVDNQITILGGRNIADEYFGLNAKARFHDDDVLAIGPIVKDVSRSFDIYWNHRTALPAPAFCRPVENPKAVQDLLREEFAEIARDAASTKYGEATRAKVTAYLNERGDIFRWAPYQFVVDNPDKGIPSRADKASLIIKPLAESISKADKRLMVISPYFVPTDQEIEDYAKLSKQKGIEVIIVTNSLAANNMFLVHGGYAPARKPLLRAGVKIYEARADSHVEGSEHIDVKNAVTTLHTKEFIVDSKELFIGSFNFDPRSINLNTECGVIIRDPKLAEEVAKGYEDSFSTHAFEVFLNNSGRLRWRTLMDGKPKVFRQEPQTSLLQRFLGHFARIAPKSQL